MVLIRREYCATMQLTLRFSLAVKQLLFNNKPKNHKYFIFMLLKQHNV